MGKRHDKITGDLFRPNPEWVVRDRARRRSRPGITAWLLEWVPPEVADGKKAVSVVGRRHRRILAVLSGRWAQDRVYEVARALYIAENATPAGMLALLLNRKERPHMLQATLATVESDTAGTTMKLPVNGILFRIGRSPCLYARRVRGLRENARGQLEWLEPVLPDGARWPRAMP